MARLESFKFLIKVVVAFKEYLNNISNFFDYKLKVYYKMMKDNLPFEVDELNGVIITKEIIDREVQSLYKFNITGIKYQCNRKI